MNALKAETEERVVDSWMQGALKALALRVGYTVIPTQIGADGARELLRNAYKSRAELNHLIERAECALREIDAKK